jgi:hypothetical protein
MFKASKLIIIIINFAAFSVSMVPLVLNSPFPIILVQFFWITLYTAFSYFSIQINLYQMTYFYIICLYSKLKLRNANNGIRKSFEKKYKMTNHRMKNILISLDSIISQINTYNNDLWSKYLMIVLISVGLLSDLGFFEAIFGKMSFYLKITMFYASSILFLLMIILINTTSSVSFKANKSYKLLNKLFVTKVNKQISICNRIKVWILKIKLIFK